MGVLAVLLALLLFRSALSINDDMFDSFDVIVPEDDPDIESYLDRQTRSGDKFLRFGKAFWDYDNGGNEVPAYDDIKEVQRPPRTGRQGKNDQFIRFGRSNQDLLRFGVNPQQRTARDKSSFLRFGRSTSEGGKKKRDKRDISSSPESMKRRENFLRFGRNSNFMRFGRSFMAHNHVLDEEGLNAKQNVDSRNKYLLNYLRNLLRQSEENRHKNEI